MVFVSILFHKIWNLWPEFAMISFSSFRRPDSGKFPWSAIVSWSESNPPISCGYTKWVCVYKIGVHSLVVYTTSQFFGWLSLQDSIDTMKRFLSAIVHPELIWPPVDEAVHNAERTLNLAYTNVGKLWLSMAL